jgi:hypothetical protein
MGCSVEVIRKYVTHSKSLFIGAVSMDDRVGDASLKTLMYKFEKAVLLRKKFRIVDKILKTPREQEYWLGLQKAQTYR